MKTTKNLTYAIAMRRIGFPVAYAPGDKQGWKLDADGKIEMRDGNPVYIDAQGAELALGADTVGRLNGEARSHRERADTAEASLKAFEGIDPKKAKDALDTVGKLDQKKLIDAGEVDRVRAEIESTYKTQLTEKDTEIAKLRGDYDGLQLQTKFTGSKWITDNIAVPVDMLQSTFGKNFKTENGKLISVDNNGNKIFSKKNAGEYADFDESIEILVNGYSQRDSILKGTNHTGTGNDGAGGANGGKRIVRRADFEKLSPIDQAATAAKMTAGELVIQD